MINKLLKWKSCCQKKILFTVRVAWYCGFNRYRMRKLAAYPSLHPTKGSSGSTRYLLVGQTHSRISDANCS